MPYCASPTSMSNHYCPQESISKYPQVSSCVQIKGSKMKQIVKCFKSYTLLAFKGFHKVTVDETYQLPNYKKAQDSLKIIQVLYIFESISI
jgi:hypothetical protein